MVKGRSKKNLITGLLYQVVNTALALILPHLFITSFGSETNGLLSSVGQLFVYLGLLEAGVGTATVQALYKPIAEQDKNEINAILSATKKYYIKTGVLYSVALLLLCLVYPFLIDSQLSASTIRQVIILQGAGQIVSFFVQAKYALLLTAEGKSYILNSLMLAECVLRNVGKIVAISLGYGIIAVQTVHFLILCLYALAIVLYIHSRYKWLDLKADANYQAISQKNSVLVQAVAWIVFNHTDIMVLTIVTRDLKLVSVYSVYALVFEVVQNVINTVRDSFQYKIGYYSQRSKVDLSIYYRKYSTIIYGFAYACFAATYVLAAPFIRLYTVGVTDTDYLICFLPELFVLYKILYCIRVTNRQLIEAGGHFKATQGIALREASINMAVSLVMVFSLHIYGVLIGTIAALLYSTIAYSNFIKKQVLDKQYGELLTMQIPNLMILLAVLLLGQQWKIVATDYLQLALRTAPFAAAIFLAYGALAFFQLQSYVRNERS